MRFNLLSLNAKTEKNAKLGKFVTAGLSLAPHTLAKIDGVTTCENATPMCKSVCNLWFAGRTVMPNVRDAMIRRTKLLFEDREQFEKLLRKDLDKLQREADKLDMLALCRLNVASDLDWRWIAQDYPSVRFYDYTKVRSRLAEVKNGNWGANYELTYSVSEQSHQRTIGAYLRAGFNVAAVFDTEYNPQSHKIGALPSQWRFDGRDWPIIDGDEHDVRLRQIDGFGVIVGLRFKGSRKRMQTAVNRGFVFAT